MASAAALVMTSCGVGASGTNVTASHGAQGSGTNGTGDASDQSGSSSMTVSPGQSNCFRDFTLPSSLPLPSARAPNLAVKNFLLHGSILGPAAPRINPVSYGFPASGWMQIRQGEKSATFQSGNSTLHLVLNSSNRWEVDAGTICHS